MEIVDPGGMVVARADMVFVEQSTIGEFDGRLKYRAATAGRPLEDVLWAEKRREDPLRALGWEVVGVTWADIERHRSGCAVGFSPPSPAPRDARRHPAS